MRKYWQELFYALTGVMVIFPGMEILWPGLVLSYFNLNWILILWVITGIILLLDDNKESLKK